ncbi:hypothetical protein BKA00_005567 [Actinomadura coerulea]|uniref:Uncharacterized protein n=1 Tax=Actinomadura coerulea TaxID=46159 RepID=A0A7X0G395_9ACTN|nr:hypothetical protein [Actinomadura coerulea]
MASRESGRLSRAAGTDEIEIAGAEGVREAGG